MYSITFRRCADSREIKIRIAEWSDLLKWLGECSGIKELLVEMEE